MTTTVLDDRMTGPTARPSTLRMIIGYVAVAGMLPYLILKTIWVLGGSVGVSDRSILDDPTLATANWVTLGMEVIAALVAVALTQRWGARLPAWLVVFPVWVAAGLLVPRVLVMPFTALVSSHSDSEPTARIAMWMYAMVSCSFAVQGVAVLTAFVLYCRARWGRLLLEPARTGGATHGFQRVVVGGSCGLGGLIVAIGGLGALLAPSDERSTHLVSWGNSMIWMALALAGALILVGQVGGAVRGWIPLCMVLVGSGAMVWWGVWDQVMAVAPSALADAHRPPLLGVASLGGLCVGLALALTAAFSVAERGQPTDG